MSNPNINQLCDLITKNIDNISCNEIKQTKMKCSDINKINRTDFINSMKMVCNNDSGAAFYDKMHDCICGSKKLSAGAIAGIVIGSVVGFMIIIYLLFLLKKSKSK